MTGLMRPPRKGCEMKTYSIVHKNRNRDIVLARGIYSPSRAQAWIANYNPNHYDKGSQFRREDLIAIEEAA